jgi:hypothetical protein
MGRVKIFPETATNMLIFSKGMISVSQDVGSSFLRLAPPLAGSAGVPVSSGQWVGGDFLFASLARCLPIGARPPFEFTSLPESPGSAPFFATSPCHQ